MTSIAVVGPGENASPAAIADAAKVGRAIAERGWVTLTGGRDAGVMDAAARGATEVHGIAIGILPGTDKEGASSHLSIALPTGLGEARNAVLVTAADAVIACGMNPGTASEVALALRAGKPVAIVRPTGDTEAFFAKLGDVVPYITADPVDAVAHLAPFL
ncbi:MAG TPA: hypothetical protein VJO33_07285 [Gemmatimonadaceae bacterium]|nr:hypothetical protein [Gemmatimonadaceae bacterium]